jgi:acylphosphatase
MASHLATEAIMSASHTQKRCVRVRIEGRVQGVGFRAFIEREAQRIGVDGLVRNRRDGGVEAVFAGTSEPIDAMLDACRRGPRGSRVDMVKVFDETCDVPSGFVVQPTI